MIGLKCDRILLPDGFFDGFVYVEEEKIVSVTDQCLPCDELLDFTGKILSPGFIDIHTHGAGGCSFSGSGVEAVIHACHHHLRHGTTTLLPTVSTAPFATMAESLDHIVAARRSPELKNRIAGAHMEGPYLSVKQCGAQNTDYITAPNAEDYEALVRRHPGQIARWTYAPERDPEGRFCTFLMKNGILPSVGHSDATYEELSPAVDAGCRLVTHLYSATSTVTRSGGFRSLGVIETAFLREDLLVEIIADGRHLPPELIQMILKIKGVDSVIAVTDSLFPAGTDMTEGVSDGVAFIVEDGVCKLPDRSAFAGSIATADRLVRVLTKDCGLPLHSAVGMLTAVPARLLGLNAGTIGEGKLADLIVFDDNIRIGHAFVGGQKVL